MGTILLWLFLEIQQRCIRCSLCFRFLAAETMLIHRFAMVFIVMYRYQNNNGSRWKFFFSSSRFYSYVQNLMIPTSVHFCKENNNLSVITVKGDEMCTPELAYARISFCIELNFFFFIRCFFHFPLFFFFISSIELNFLQRNNYTFSKRKIEQRRNFLHIILYKRLLLIFWLMNKMLIWHDGNEETREWDHFRGIYSNLENKGEKFGDGSQAMLKLKVNWSVHLSFWFKKSD